MRKVEAGNLDLLDWEMGEWTGDFVESPESCGDGTVS